MIGEEEEAVVVGVALLARIDLNPPVGVESIVVLTGDVDAPIADLTGLATLGDTNCMGLAADLVGLGDLRRARWSIFTCIAQYVKTYLKKINNDGVKES